MGDSCGVKCYDGPFWESFCESFPQRYRDGSSELFRSSRRWRSN